MTDALVAFLLSTLYGFFKSITDIRRDQPGTNWLYRNLSVRFYNGGSTYSQRFPWDQDLWHLADDCKLLVLILAFLYPIGEPWYFFVYVIPMYWWAGRVFSLFYHSLWPDVPSQSVWTWAKNCILFWRPENK